jgi:D-serine dehydratase
LDLRASTVKTVADYDSWYHEAAIQEANRTQGSPPRARFIDDDQGLKQRCFSPFS